MHSFDHTNGKVHKNLPAPTYKSQQSSFQDDLRIWYFYAVALSILGSKLHQHFLAHMAKVLRSSENGLRSLRVKVLFIPTCHQASQTKSYPMKYIGFPVFYTLLQPKCKYRASPPKHISFRLSRLVHSSYENSLSVTEVRLLMNIRRWAKRSVRSWAYRPQRAPARRAE